MDQGLMTRKVVLLCFSFLIQHLTIPNIAVVSDYTTDLNSYVYKQNGIFI